MREAVLRALLCACSKQSTNERNVRTQLTNVSKTHANHVQFRNARVGLWITRFSAIKAVAS